MPAIKRRRVPTLPILSLALLIPLGCFTAGQEEPEGLPGFARKEIQRRDLPAADTNGYYYLHNNYYSGIHYFGDPDSMVNLLKDSGLVMKEVWVDSGPCFTGGKEIGPVHTLLMRSDTDYGPQILLPRSHGLPVLGRILVGTKLDNFFHPCESGRRFFHYRSKP